MSTHYKKYGWLVGCAGLPAIIVLLSFFLLSPIQADEPRDYVCGDADGEGQVNVSDAVYIINYVFTGGNPPVPNEAGDANEDELVNVSDAVYILNYIFTGGLSPCPTPYGNLVDYVFCKDYSGVTKDFDFPQNHNCIVYSYNGQSTLQLKHVNGCFNCCPEEIFGNVYIIGNLIRIVEDETLWEGVGCPCLCLFDMNYQISDLAPGIYTIRVESIYLMPVDYLELTVDLTANPVDTLCVERIDYPWGL